MNKIIVIGMMSGTSVDGLDIAACEFSTNNSRWEYEILSAETIQYPKEMAQKLVDSTSLSGYELTKLDVDLGTFMGQAVKDFLSRTSVKAGFIGSHGHTVFHQPVKNITLQIGDPQQISLHSGIPVYARFRNLDVLLGGQGAPLVPIGDLHLFHEFPFCLNLGGFANISIKSNQGEIIAFDICPANIVLNALAKRKGLPYDDQGAIAATGTLLPDVLHYLNQLQYYKLSPPKSLGKEWVDEFITSQEWFENERAEDLLHTFCHHIAIQVNHAITGNARLEHGQVLVTGGGAFNDYLIENFKKYSNPGVEYYIPDDKLVNYKEALIFAFLALLNSRDQINTLKSVTGATRDSIGGVLFKT